MTLKLEVRCIHGKHFVQRFVQEQLEEKRGGGKQTKKIREMIVLICNNHINKAEKVKAIYSFFRQHHHQQQQRKMPNTNNVL